VVLEKLKHGLLCIVGAGNPGSVTHKSVLQACWDRYIPSDLAPHSRAIWQPHRPFTIVSMHPGDTSGRGRIASGLGYSATEVIAPLTCAQTRPAKIANPDVHQEVHFSDGGSVEVRHCAFTMEVTERPIVRRFY
jgi:hypothetical protein